MKKCSKNIVIKLIDCKISQLKVELNGILVDLDAYFGDHKDNIDMPSMIIRMHKILTNIDKANNEYDKKRGQDLLQRYATVKYAIKNLKDVRKEIMEM